jgi:hypothetical protein
MLNETTYNVTKRPSVFNPYTSMSVELVNSQIDSPLVSTALLVSMKLSVYLQGP